MTRVLGRGALVAAAVAFGLAPSGRAAVQDPAAARQVFRAGANFVAVDAYPTRDGKIVPDLTREDFQVFEDGKSQSIEQFEFVRGVPDGPDAEPRPTRLEAAERLAGDPRRRVFVVYLTGYQASHEGAANTQKATTAFFNQSVSASDLFGVMRLYDDVRDLVLGDRPDVLVDEANGYWDWSSLPHPKGWPRLPAEEPVFSCIMQMRTKTQDDVERIADQWRAKRILGSLEELVVRLASMREARSNVLVFAGPLPLPMNVGQNVSTSSSSSRSIEPAPQGDPVCANELRGITRPYLASKVDNILATAKRGNVSISFIEPAGLAIFDDDISTPDARAKTTHQSVVAYEGVKTVAVMTGGTAIVGATEIGPALIKIADGQSGHYELGYYSSNNKFDGKFRSIDVKVKAPGVSVLARKGYQAPTAAMFKASQDAAARSGQPPPAPTAVQQALAELQRINPEANLYNAAARRGDRVVVVAEISSAQIELGRWTTGATVDVQLNAPGRTPAGAGRADLPRGARSALVDVPLEEKYGPWTASVRIKSADRELVDRIDVPSVAGKLLGDPLVFRASTLPNSSTKPVADFAFRRTERIHVEWTVLTPLDQRQARLLDARGQPLPVNASATDIQSTGTTVLAADIALTQLAPGDYVVEVVVGAGAASETKLFAFRVVR